MSTSRLKDPNVTRRPIFARAVDPNHTRGDRWCHGAEADTSNMEWGHDVASVEMVTKDATHNRVKEASHGQLQNKILNYIRKKGGKSEAWRCRALAGQVNSEQKGFRFNHPSAARGRHHQRRKGNPADWRDSLCVLFDGFDICQSLAIPLTEERFPSIRFARPLASGGSLHLANTSVFGALCGIVVPRWIKH